MDTHSIETTALAAEIARTVVSETSFWVAIVGLVGVLIGAVVTVAGNILLHKMQDGPRQKLDNNRKELLKKMLNDSRFPKGWRSLSTLSRVIGADSETTKKLLFEVGARGSEKDDDMWGLIERHPFNKNDE